MDKAERSEAFAPAHPGELLAEVVLPATGKSRSEIARLLGISRQSLYDIIDCKQSVTPAMAVRFGKLFGNGPDLWLNMQARHDLWIAKRDVDVSGIPTLAVA
jgi:addiction module HigA family antidote